MIINFLQSVIKNCKNPLKYGIDWDRGSCYNSSLLSLCALVGTNYIIGGADRDQDQSDIKLLDLFIFYLVFQGLYLATKICRGVCSLVTYSFHYFYMVLIVSQISRISLVFLSISLFVFLFILFTLFKSLSYLYFLFFGSFWGTRDSGLFPIF